MIEKLYIHNYRNFVNCEIPFNKDFTLLCGKNGTGKTAVVELLYKLVAFIGSYSLHSDDVISLVSYSDAPRWSRGDDCYTDIGLTIRMQQGVFKYSIQVASIPKEDGKIIENHIAKESLFLGDALLYQLDGKEVSTVDDRGQTRLYPSENRWSGLNLASQMNKTIKTFITYCQTQIYSLSFNLGGVSSPRDDNIYLNFDGSNFEYWYANKLLNYVDEAAQAHKDYREFIPNLDKVIYNRNRERLMFAQKAGDKTNYEMAFDELSAGQQKLCIYYFLLNIAEEGSTIILDELENHLSPAELYPLYHQMQTVADERDVQFIIVSHNPKTLNWYHKEAIVFSTIHTPAIVKVECYDYENAQESLFEYVGNAE